MIPQYKDKFPNDIKHNNINQDQSKKQREKNSRLTSPLSDRYLSGAPILYGILLGVLSAGLILAIIISLWLTSNNTRTSTKDKSTTTLTTSTTTSITSSTTTTTTTTSTTPRYPISCFATVTASNFSAAYGTPTQQADGLVDRPNIHNGTFFDAGGYPPQWVQLELPGLCNITRINLLVAQEPNGTTHHQILIGSNSSSLQVIADFTNNTYVGEWLNFTYNPELTNVRFVRVSTLSSPSFVAWAKFTVYDF